MKIIKWSLSFWNHIEIEFEQGKKSIKLHWKALSVQILKNGSENLRQIL